VTASTGNHAAATAWAAARLGLRASVYVPERTSRAKLAILERLGATVHVTGDDLDEAKEEAARHAAAHGLVFFEDGAEPRQLDGYGAIGEEIAEQAPAGLGAVVVPVGNGALLAGVGYALAGRLPGVLRVGVVAREAPVMALSWEAGHPVVSETSASIADGLAVRVAIPIAVEWLREATDRMLQVSERAIARALAALAATGIRVEPAAAAALAAVPQLADVDGSLVLVVTGRNVDDELLARARDHPESFPE
jgi:threonine dehydratase